MKLDELQQAKQFSLGSTVVEQTFLKANSWEMRYRNLMLLGKKLPAAPQSIMVNNNKVMGCESNVWLAHYHEKARNYFLVWSDSKIVKGLLVVLLSQLNGRNKTEIEQFELDKLLQKYKLADQISASRTNGLNAIYNHIIQTAR